MFPALSDLRITTAYQTCLLTRYRGAAECHAAPPVPPLRLEIAAAMQDRVRRGGTEGHGVGEGRERRGTMGV